MTKHEIIETLKRQISELEKEIETEQEVQADAKVKKYPEEDTVMYAVNILGEVYISTWDESFPGEEKVLMLRFDSGKIFLTKEAAEEFAEVQRTEDKLFALADDNKEWNGFNVHYALVYNYEYEKVDWHEVYRIKESVPYFANGDSALKAVETVGEDRVRKWLTYKRKRPEV